MALVSEKCATTDERWGDGAVWRGVFPTAGVTPPNCAKAFAAPILTNGFRSLVQSGLKSDVAPCRLCARAQSRCAPARCAGARAERPVADGEDSDSGLPRSTRV